MVHNVMGYFKVMETGGRTLLKGVGPWVPASGNYNLHETVIGGTMHTHYSAHLPYHFCFLCSLGAIRQASSSATHFPSQDSLSPLKEMAVSHLGLHSLKP